MIVREVVTHGLLLSLISIPLLHDHVVSMASIPLVGGITGYVINRTGVWMLYQPIHFRGVHVPGLEALAGLLPGKLREVPGLRHGGIGWQGIIPSRAGKLGSIAVEKQIQQIGSPGEFYERLDPEAVAEHIVAESQDDVEALVDRIMEEEHPELWRELPARARATLHSRVREQLPEVVREVTTQVGRHIDDLLDVRQMVIRLADEHPELTNKLFHEVGSKEFRFIIRFGFVFGFVCGLPAILLVEAVPKWWVLPLAQAVIGYATNWLGIWMIYEPLEPRRLGPIKLHGLFPRRQPQAAAAYGDVMADEVVTLGNIGEELLRGPRSDRTRQLIGGAMRPAVDRAAGVAGTAVRTAEPGRYEAVREGIVVEAPETTLEPLQDEDFARRRSAAIRELFTARMREMSPGEFSETLRAATSEDEWMLVAHGALFGVIGGLLHYVIFGL